MENPSTQKFLGTNTRGRTSALSHAFVPGSSEALPLGSGAESESYHSGWFSLHGGPVHGPALSGQSPYRASSINLQIRLLLRRAKGACSMRCPGSKISSWESCRQRSSQSHCPCSGSGGIIFASRSHSHGNRGRSNKN